MFVIIISVSVTFADTVKVSVTFPVSAAVIVNFSITRFTLVAYPELSRNCGFIIIYLFIFLLRDTFIGHFPCYL